MEGLGRRAGLAVAVAIAAPLALLGVLLSRDSLDGAWQSAAAHFWLVLLAGGLNVLLGYTVGSWAQRRGDARLFLVSLAFVTAAGFLGLHALATPGVLVGRNAGFELATPVGLLLAGLFSALSVIDLGPVAARRLLAHARAIGAVVLGVLVLWGAVSLAEAWPLGDPLAGEDLDGWQLALALGGVVLYGVAGAGYLRLQRRRGGRMLLAVAVAFVLLADAMLAIVWATNWHLSWWEWHGLMLAAFATIALAARAEWHEERFSPLYLDDTLSTRREVSVLLADLAGYTSYSERHPADEVTRMLNGYFDRLVPLLEDLGGEVHQIVGDQLMVVFNKRGDQEGHALLAARAALELQAAAGEIGREEPSWPRFRVGVNSGEVVAGLVGGARGHRKHSVVGDPINVAARLQTLAPVGGVVVGADTLRRLEGALVEPLPPQQVRGKQAPLQAYVLRGLRVAEPGQDGGEPL